MNYWLLLADPKSYGFDDLESDKKTVWDGISGSLAQKHLRSCHKGDKALIYNTAPDKHVAGTADIVTSPYPDAGDATGKRVVVDLKFGSRLTNPVSLAAMKENKKLAGMKFLKIQRIAVLPISSGEFEEIVRMGR